MSAMAFVFHACTMPLLIVDLSHSTTSSDSCFHHDSKPNYRSAASPRTLAHMPERRCAFQMMLPRPNPRFFHSIARQFSAKHNRLDPRIAHPAFNPADIRPVYPRFFSEFFLGVPLRGTESGDVDSEFREGPVFGGHGGHHAQNNVRKSADDRLQCAWGARIFQIRDFPRSREVAKGGAA